MTLTSSCAKGPKPNWVVGAAVTVRRLARDLPFHFHRAFSFKQIPCPLPITIPSSSHNLTSLIRGAAMLNFKWRYGAVCNNC
ncbi:hypothetical protein CRYUN_Cryun37aG0136100 [Craigia yunnanensis]